MLLTLAAPRASATDPNYGSRFDKTAAVSQLPPEFAAKRARIVGGNHPDFKDKFGCNALAGACRSCRFVGARPSGCFSMNEPTRLEFSEICGRSDSEAALTPRSDADKLWMHGALAREFV